ncbi:MAG: radical SAM protein, partial [Bacteroidota bacterium]
MKILLINPPRSPENNILKYAPKAAKRFIHKKLIGPPLGLLTVAAAVKDHDVVLFDTKGEYDLDPATPPLRKLVKELVERHRPDVVGVTVITSEFNDSVTICKVVKEVNPEILTVAGGLHATLLPFDFTDHSVDVVIPGQCAHIFRELMRAKAVGMPLESVAGILIRQQGVLVKTAGKPSPWDAACEDYLAIDRGHLAKWISTYRVGNSPDPSTYVFTSLGCPYKCTFCSIWTQFLGKYHQRTVESLIQELQSIPEYSVVRFADANTVVDMAFMNQLFARIVEERIEKTLVMDIRADVAANHPEIIEKMARGGLKVVICGFESFRDEELKRYKKESRLQTNRRRCHSPWRSEGWSVQPFPTRLCDE